MATASGSLVGSPLGLVAVGSGVAEMGAEGANEGSAVKLGPVLGLALTTGLAVD